MFFWFLFFVVALQSFRILSYFFLKFKGWDSLIRLLIDPFIWNVIGVFQMGPLLIGDSITELNIGSIDSAEGFHFQFVVCRSHNVWIIMFYYLFGTHIRDLEAWLCLYSFDKLIAVIGNKWIILRNQLESQSINSSCPFPFVLAHW